jgi:hypothetical protein
MAQAAISKLSFEPVRAKAELLLAYVSKWLSKWGATTALKKKCKMADGNRTQEKPLPHTQGNSYSGLWS